MTEYPLIEHSNIIPYTPVCMILVVVFFCVIVLDEAAVTSEWVLKEEHLTVLLSYVEDFCHKWYSIGMGLGFITPELDQIKAMPRLLMEAPRSYLIELLSQWVQWPTKKHPTKPTLAAFCSTLRSQLVNLGSLAETVERGMNQAGTNIVGFTMQLRTKVIRMCF